MNAPVSVMETAGEGVDIESNDFNQQNMVVLAQRLINDPLTEAFKVLCDGFGTTGGDEE